jgi:hypothetical protein
MDFGIFQMCVVHMPALLYVVPAAHILAHFFTSIKCERINGCELKTRFYGSLPSCLRGVRITDTGSGSGHIIYT